MPLLELSNELILNILSNDCLSQSDRYHVLLTGPDLRNIGETSLYAQVCISARPSHTIEGKYILTDLESFINRVDQNPIFAPLVRTAELYWDGTNPARTKELFGVLFKLTSLENLSLACANGFFSISNLLRNIDAFKRLSGLPKLRHIQLSTFRRPVSDTDLEALFFCLPQLDKFSLIGFDGFTDYGNEISPNVPRAKLTTIEFLGPEGLPSEPELAAFLGSHSSLHTLKWTTVMRDISQSRKVVNAALSPLKSTLVNLCIMLVLPSQRDQDLGNRISLDFSGFSALENLKIHERVMFSRARPSSTSSPEEELQHFGIHEEDLPSRLPSSLKTMTVSIP